MKDFYAWGSVNLLPDRCCKKEVIVDIASSNLSHWRKEDLKGIILGEN
ncbi:MAG: hypothetical protein ACTSRX_02160 [Promethearchaeota archaeon]